MPAVIKLLAMLLFGSCLFRNFLDWIEIATLVLLPICKLKRSLALFTQFISRHMLYHEL